MSTNLRVRVAAKSHETAGICVFELVNPDGGKLPAFTAGAHIDISLPGKPTRQYSLCNSPQERRRYMIAVQREATSRGVSLAMHETVKTGDELLISAPKNHFTLASGTPHSVLFAAGIGITPILSMAEQLAAEDASFEVHYGTRSRSATAFHERIGASKFGAQTRLYFSAEASSTRMDIQALLSGMRQDAHIYVCGPARFTDSVLGSARAAGWAEARLHWEFFSGEVAQFDSDSDFDVRLASSGKLVRVPKGTTIIAALSAAGVTIETACEQGVCGTCLTRVLDGVPDHRDMYLTPVEQAGNDQFLPCCSRAKSPVLVLDL